MNVAAWYDSARRFWDSRSPALRLTLAYAAIIMVISVCFSVSLYRVSADQLKQGLRNQYLHYRSYGGFVVPPSVSSYDDELRDGTQRLALELVYFNLIILIVGTGLSYWLAKRTVRPIEEALEAQSRFTGDASHELRTPLTAMQTEIEVALRNPGLTKEEAKALLTSNLEEVAKLRALSDGLLRLARRNGAELATQTVSLEDVASETMNQLIPVAQARGVAIQNEVGAIAVQGDQVSLRELAVILVDNALKYSDRGTTVRLTAKRQGKQAYFSVIDEGHGIRASDLPHIFDRFYRSDSSRSKVQADGYGLGLSIAKKIVDLHRGSIEVRSTLGKGSTFIVKLPVASA